MQSWPHNVFDGSLATGPCSKHWLCTERTVCMSWAMARRLSLPCKGQGLGQTVSASQAKHVRSRDLLSKQFYINAWMCPKPKPQRIYNQKRRQGAGHRAQGQGTKGKAGLQDSILRFSRPENPKITVLQLLRRKGEGG